VRLNNSEPRSETMMDKAQHPLLIFLSPPRRPGFLTLAGQHKAYLVKQLRDFRHMPFLTPAKTEA